MNSLQSHLISSESTIVEALEALNRLSGETMTLFVTDIADIHAERQSSSFLLGSLTDGDIRRALLSGHELSDKVANICKRACLRLTEGHYDAAILSEARSRGVKLLPVVSNTGNIVSMVDLRNQRGLISADGVLMAGGAGERLRPLTEKTPKPLLPVGERPIIDHNVDLMRDFGIRNIYVTVNYLKEQLKEHFGANPKGEDTVACIEEPTKLGTIGSLSLIKTFRSPHIVVMNADLLTDINLEEMYLKHLDTEAFLTMAVIPYAVSVPYAIVEHRGDKVEGLTEKPTYNYYANAGIYMIRREVAESIPEGRYMDATDLIDSLLREGRRVSQFKIDGRWIDIGSPDDYRHACEIMC